MTPRIVARWFVVLAALVTATAASAQQQGAQVALKGPGGSPDLHGFSITLVVGELQGAPTADTVPAAARRALTDMKDFLPYKSYRLVDSAWILGTASGRGSTSRLGGPGNEQYELFLSSTKAGARSDLQLSFRLRQVGVVDDGARRAEVANAEMADLRALRTMLEATLAKLKDQAGDRQAELVKTQERLLVTTQRLSALEAGASPSARTVVLIDTNFSMDVGETVVVGTSRVQGDKAMIALLTAAPRIQAK